MTAFESPIRKALRASEYHKMTVEGVNLSVGASEFPNPSVTTHQKSRSFKSEMAVTSSSAVKIVHLQGDKIVSAEDEIFEHSDFEKIKDKKVCIISITGVFRQGKSFLLNFLLRYLDLKYKKKTLSTEKWLNLQSDDISGFEWKCGSERHTTGILMWSEIFLAELPSKEEVAIILLDTQGTFDNQTTKQHCAAIFAISTLISSVQIYNLKGQINQADLEHLECFSGIGKLLVDGNSSEKAFQNLWFLIRDWQNPFEFNYGSDGGKTYLDKFMNSAKTPKELRKQNENIHQLFDKIECCLLPHPGQTVATNPDFRGNLKDIDATFLKHVENFVPSILSPENLTPKKINGEEIKLADLPIFIQSYCQHFMNAEMPKLETMYMATCEAQHKAALIEAEMLYQQEMNILVDETSEIFSDEDLDSQHVKKKSQAVEYFRNKKLLGEDMKNTSLNKLNQILDTKVEFFKKLNKTKREKQEDLERYNKDLQVTKDEFETKVANCNGIIRNQANEILDFKAAQTEMKQNIENNNEIMKDQSDKITQFETNYVKLQQEIQKNQKEKKDLEDAVSRFETSQAGLQEKIKNLEHQLNNNQRVRPPRGGCSIQLELSHQIKF